MILKNYCRKNKIKWEMYEYKCDPKPFPGIKWSNGKEFDPTYTQEWLNNRVNEHIKISKFLASMQVIEDNYLSRLNKFMED